MMDNNGIKKQQDKNQQEEVGKQEKKPGDALQKLEEEKKSLEEKYKRALADYQNLEKRVQEDRGKWARFANRELLLRILPILDTLMLAEKHSQDQTLKVSVQQFLNTLKEEGITKIETVGKEFDPHCMECIQMLDEEENAVVEEIRAGYMYYDKLLRPAQVKVGKKMSS